MLRRIHRERPGLTVACGVCFVLAAMAAYRPLARRFRGHHEPVPAVTPSESGAVELASGQANALRVKPEVIDRLGIKVVAAEAGSLSNSLALSGSLGLDPARLQEVRSRFAGEVVELGRIPDGSRALQFGDAVKTGQLLAVLWSRELGEKKSELIDAQVQLSLDSTTLSRLESLNRDGAVPEREYREAAQAVEVDANAVARIVRTLRMWRVNDEELSAVEEEAKRLIATRESVSGGDEGRWARSEIRAALDGVLLEFNAAIGDVASTDDVLFKVGDLSRMQVIAFAYEEDLPRLDRLPMDRRQWTVSVPSAPDTPPQRGEIDRIGRVVDPVQHTTAVMGWVDNSVGLLRAGQFIAATVDLPPPGNESVVPATALIEKGGEKLVFVQVDADPVFVQRRVSLSRIVGSQACLHIEPPSESADSTEGLQPGERVVASGAVELQQSLVDLQAAQPTSTTNPSDDSRAAP